MAKKSSAQKQIPLDDPEPEVAEFAPFKPANTTELATVKPPQDDFVVTTTDQAIQAIKNEASNLVLAGVRVEGNRVIVEDPDAMLADKEGLKSLKEFHMKVVVKQRTACDKEHKKLKADAWAECTRLDGWKRDMTAKILETETILEKMESAVEEELDRRAKAKADALFASRKSMLEDAGADSDSIDEQSVRRMDEDAFHRELARATAAKAQAEAVEKERLRNEEIRKQLEEESRLQKLEIERLAAAQDEKARLEKIESDRIAAVNKEAERALKEKQDAFEKSMLEQQEKLNQQRIELEKQIAEEKEAIRLQKEKADEQLRVRELPPTVEEPQQETQVTKTTPFYASHVGYYPPANFPEKQIEFSEGETVSAPLEIETVIEVPSDEEPDPWHIIAARDVCEWINDRGGVAPFDREDLESVSDLILAAYACRKTVN